MTDQPDTVQHEGEYWLTVDIDDTVYISPVSRLGSPSRGSQVGFWWHPQKKMEVPELAPLADEDQPVRVRLELRAVRVEEESDGE